MEKKNQCGFAKDVNEYLAIHEVKGLSDYSDFQKYASAAAAGGEVDATVTPCHKRRIVRFWGGLSHLRLMRKWGLDVDEFDPDAAARGCCPDVIFCETEPYYSVGDVEQILQSVRRGTHFIVLRNTHLWSEAIAKRLGHTFKGILAAKNAGNAVLFQNDPKLFAGFPEGRLDATRFAFLRDRLFGMYMAGDRCLLGVADPSQRRIATAVAQYRYGKGAVTLVGPYAEEGAKSSPEYKRFILNLIGYLPKVCGVTEC